MKKTLLVIIDAYSGRIARELLNKGDIPNMEALIERGAVNFESIAVFPSITPAATSSLATGCYPREHGIAGNYWYEEQDKTVIYYGADPLALLNRGIGEFFDDFLVRFNNERLSATTIFQYVERAGMISASLNFLIFNGDTPHKVDVPLLMKAMPGVPAETEVLGPSILSLGDLVRPVPPDRDEPLESVHGPFQRFGFSDAATARMLRSLAEGRDFPDFTLAYFPENDDTSHSEGPELGSDAVVAVDGWLGEMFEAYGGIDAFLHDIAIVITGDHGQSAVGGAEQNAGVNLQEVLADLSVAAAGHPMNDASDLVGCPNLRVAQLYLHSPTAERVDEIRKTLHADHRIDQVLWMPSRWGDEPGYIVQTADAGQLRFWSGDDGEQHATDRYGGTWSWTGNLATVDGRVEDGIIDFDSYPNAFERIAGLLDLKTSGHIVVTVKPGYEFELKGINVHYNGGSHASLHALDSRSPLIMAGAPQGITLPDYPRSVDITPLCLQILGLDVGLKLGASHEALNWCRNV